MNDVIDDKPRKVSLYREIKTGLMHQVDTERGIWRKEANPNAGDWGEWFPLQPLNVVQA